MKEQIKKYIGEILLLVGVFMFIYNAFNLSSSRDCGMVINLLGPSCNNPIRYFYRDNVLFMMSLGVVLLTTGIIIKKQKQERK